MNQATKTRMTFQEYLAYDDGTDKHDENKITVFICVNSFLIEPISADEMVI